HELRREPLGVAAAFLAWNFPLLNLAYKIGPAMAAGCPIVIKPSVKTPLSAYAVGELCAQIGLPAGVVNIISGPDHKVGDAISSSTIPALLTLIGSTNVGKHVIGTGATSIKRYSMELGGNAPAIVFADADLNTAADVISGVKFSNAGQICVTPNRVFVDETIVAQFIDMLLIKASNVKVGFDKNADIDMGPLMDEASWIR
ncbi:aldehyde dehydrogenase family protein, partial [Vibrio cyclitrophicus]|uniref:aldehyde dehydrogenase family protein n=2 Tax=Gammaproteobacteria TaxID=1236 RepID=UPI000A722310